MALRELAVIYLLLAPVEDLPCISITEVWEPIFFFLKKITSFDYWSITTDATASRSARGGQAGVD